MRQPALSLSKGPALSLSKGLAWGLVAVLGASAPAAAQQGSLQVSAAAQATTGEVQPGAGLSQLEPDLGVSWLQPGTRFGTLQLELRGTERQNELHFGRIYGSLRDLKYRGFKWTVEAGDSYYAPTIGEYRFSNLYTPAVTFVGASVGARSARTDVGLVAGQGTVWRNIFGSDPDTLDQRIIAGRAAHHASDRVDLSARGSRIRTEDLDEFSYSIAASDQAGGGMRYAVTSSVQVIADGSVVWYRRAGSTIRERDGSGLVGLHWLHSRGWLQINASRFSPGESPTLTSPLPDRAGQFAAGEFDLLKRLRVFGGWEAFRSNLDPSAVLAAGYQLPRSSGTRQFGGIRAQVGSRSTLTLRAEAGDRISKYVTGRQDIESDTGVWSADWHAAVKRMNGFLRVAQRNNVTSASLSGSYTQRDVAGQFFLRLSQSAQIFGLATATRTTDEAGGGNTFWQAGGGAQVQVVRQGLWMRTEGTVSRNADLLTQLFLPRESLSLGFNGYVTSRTSVGIDIYLDRAPLSNTTASPWATRSIVRLIQTLPTGSPFTPGASGLFPTAPTRAIATVKGMVFADWNGNGLQEAGENPVQGVPLRLERLGATETGKNGEFVFRHVPDGLHEVGLDLGALPIDFEAPPIPRLQVALSGNDTRQVAFGLIPLGTIRGRVVRDLNGNGTADGAEPAIDGAVVVLDAGKRSERSKRGQFSFEAVPSGEHTVTLLTESLPEGAVIAGEATRVATLQRDRMSIDLPFLIAIETRAEIRKVFPGTVVSGGPRPATSDRRDARGAPSTARAERPAPPVAPAPRPAATATDGTFALQVAAFDDPLRARVMVGELKQKGLAAYLVEPPPSDPNAPYRVRVGGYATRTDAEKAAPGVGKTAGGKVWVTREP
jgi:cell division septation protein DedD